MNHRRLPNRTVSSAVTINRKNLDISVLVLPDFLKDVPTDICWYMWFQHHETPAHYERDVWNFSLVEAFPGRLIGQGGPVALPPRSPDLTCMGFIYWDSSKHLTMQLPVKRTLSPDLRPLLVKCEICLVYNAMFIELCFATVRVYYR